MTVESKCNHDKVGRMKKIKKNWIYFLAGFLIVTGAAVLFSGKNMGKKANDQVVEPQKVNQTSKQNNVVSTPKTDKTPTVTKTEDGATEIPAKADNPPVGLADQAVVPTTADDYYRAGQELFSQNKFSDAIVKFDKAMELNDTEPNYYIEKSQAQYKLGQKDAAIETVNAGLKKIPGNDLLQSQLAILQSL